MRGKSTTVDLAAELRALPQTPEIAFILGEAEAGEYHDFKNRRYACGKVEAVRKLREAASLPRTPRQARDALRLLSERVIAGEFDEAPDDDDIEELRRVCPPELRAALGLERYDA